MASNSTSHPGKIHTPLHPPATRLSQVFPDGLTGRTCTANSSPGNAALTPGPDPRLPGTLGVSQHQPWGAASDPGSARNRSHSQQEAPPPLITSKPRQDGGVSQGDSETPTPQACLNLSEHIHMCGQTTGKCTRICVLNHVCVHTYTLTHTYMGVHTPTHVSTGST